MSDTPSAAPSPPVASGVSTPAGWYADPWQTTTWRWWDGTMWTSRTGAVAEKKPRLPSFLSVPVLLALIFVIPAVAFLLVSAPLAVLLGLVPLVIVLPVLAWLDRVEPEPRSSKIHAVLWGAAVAGLVSVIVNSIVGLTAGERWAAVLSAPMIEEISKGAGLIWALRRKELDSVVDGVAYAGWLGLGFAVIEDFTYFEAAAAEGLLWQTFFLRALLTPFAHPLFTAWTGLAVGLAVSKGRSVFPGALWGLALAIFTHAGWNGSLVWSDATQNPAIAGLAAVLFVLMFISAVVTVIRLRKAEQRRFVEAIPFLVHRYGLPAGDVQVFGDWKTLLATRKALTKPRRAQFDLMHSNLARAAALHNRPGETDPVAEAVLYAQVQKARAGQ